MKPMISARVEAPNTIIFPALVRSVLNQCNLVIINHAFTIADNNSKDIDRKYLSRFTLPYLLFCHDNFSVRNLPMIGGYSENAILLTLKYTNLQTLFIIAHEYAHILLKHFDSNCLSQKTYEEKEKEADLFALKIVLNYMDISKAYTKYDVFTAIRWLFKYQLLEESIGVLTRGENLNDFDSKYEQRRGNIQLEMIKNYNITGSTMLDFIGFFSIVKLQEILYTYGTELINTIIETFKNSEYTGEIEPWWEIIT